jgi:hypothetical protein
MGLSPWGDAFSVYASKLGLIEKAPATPQQLRGRYFERGIMLWYSDATGNQTEWFDSSVEHPRREWQRCSPDAWILDVDPALTQAQRIMLRVAGCDAKSVNWRHRDDWGESGTDLVPDYVALQLHWSCSCTTMPYWDCAALLSMDDLRVYRIHYDPDIEAILLEAGEKFWRDHVLARVPPPIGSSPAAAAYLKQRFPRNVEALRVATEEEAGLMARLKLVGEEYDAVNARCTAVENEIKLCIGDAEGLINGPWKIGYRRSKDTVGPEWSDVAQELGMRCEMLKAAYDRMIEECDKTFNAAGVKAEWPGRPDWWNQTFEQLAKAHEVVLRQGSRRLVPNWGKK